MPDTTLYYARTGNSLRAAMAVELAGIEVRKHEMNLAGKEHKQDWFVALNPAGARDCIRRLAIGLTAWVTARA